MDSERGVWLPPLPFEGGTPTNRVDGAGLAAFAASSASMRISTSSIAMSTFSGLRSRRERSTEIPALKFYEMKLTGMNDTTTPVHVIETQQNLLRDLLADAHGHTLVLMPLDQTEEVFSEHFEHHTDVGAVRSLVPEMVQEGDYM